MLGAEAVDQIGYALVRMRPPLRWQASGDRSQDTDPMDPLDVMAGAWLVLAGRTGCKARLVAASCLTTILLCAGALTDMSLLVATTASTVVQRLHSM